MLEKHRQQLIKEIVDQNNFASVKVLTDKLNSSEATILLKVTSSSVPSKFNEKLFVNDDPAGISGIPRVPAPLNIDGVNVVVAIK